MRLFTGISLPPQLTTKMEKLLSDLEPTARIHWSPVQNLHVTTKFIGEWTLARFPELSRGLFAVAPTGPRPITVKGLGFYAKERPRVFWAGVESSPALQSLAADIEATVARHGVAREKRPYSPHLTLARIPGATPLDELEAKIAPLLSCDFGSFEASEFHLYESRQGLYVKLQSYPLK
jgi:2'-5' RNA ligase